MNKLKIYYTASTILLFLSLAVLSVFIFWAVYPYKVLEIKGEVFPVVNKTIKQGGTLYFVSDNCKYMDISSTTSRAFVNSIIYYIPSTTTNVRMGCGKVTISVPVSKEMPPGKYHLQNIFQYKVNPIRVITVEHNTEMFTIVE
jgi:hypothetical protein